MTSLFTDPVLAEDGRWHATFDPGWNSIGVVHGGLVVAMMVRAAALSSVAAPASQSQSGNGGGMRPMSVTAHLHSGVQSGPGLVELRDLNSGRTSRSVEAVLSQDRRRATATILLTSDDVENVEADGGEVPLTAEPPMLGEPRPTPPVDFDPDALGPSRADFLNHMDLVQVGANAPLAASDSTLLRTWVRPRRPHPDSSAIAVLLLDAMPPSLYALRSSPSPILTIEYTVHLSPLAHFTPPGDGWLLLEQRSIWAAAGLNVDDAVLRNENGAIVGTARQLRRVLPAAGGPAATSARLGSGEGSAAPLEGTPISGEDRRRH
jgi:hypothetical protein